MSPLNSWENTIGILKSMRPSYWCDTCNRMHYYDSGIGREHIHQAPDQMNFPFASDVDRLRSQRSLQERRDGDVYFSYVAGKKVDDVIRHLEEVHVPAGDGNGFSLSLTSASSPHRDQLEGDPEYAKTTELEFDVLMDDEFKVGSFKVVLKENGECSLEVMPNSFYDAQTAFEDSGLSPFEEVNPAGELLDLLRAAKESLASRFSGDADRVLSDSEYWQDRTVEVFHASLERARESFFNNTEGYWSARWGEAPGNALRPSEDGSYSFWNRSGPFSLSRFMETLTRDTIRDEDGNGFRLKVNSIYCDENNPNSNQEMEVRIYPEEGPDSDVAIGEFDIRFGNRGNIYIDDLRGGPNTNWGLDQDSASDLVHSLKKSLLMSDLSEGPRQYQSSFPLDTANDINEFFADYMGDDETFDATNINNVFSWVESEEWRDSDGYDRDGYDEYGYNRDGYNEDGYDEYGYDENHRDSWGDLDPEYEGDPEFDPDYEERRMEEAQDRYNSSEAPGDYYDEGWSDRTERNADRFDLNEVPELLGEVKLRELIGYFVNDISFTDRHTGNKFTLAPNGPGSWSSGTPSVSFSIQVRDDDGEKLSNCGELSLRINSHGRIYCPMFKIPTEYQGSGFANAVVGAAINKGVVCKAKYFAMGSAWVGRYAWASVGFEFSNDYDRDFMVDKFYQFAEGMGLKDYLPSWLDEGKIKYPWDIAYLDLVGDSGNSIKLPAPRHYDNVESHMKVGKAFMLSGYCDGWEGQFDLDPNGNSIKVYMTAKMGGDRKTIPFQIGHSEVYKAVKRAIYILKSLLPRVWGVLL